MTFLGLGKDAGLVKIPSFTFLCHNKTLLLALQDQHWSDLVPNNNNANLVQLQTIL